MAITGSLMAVEMLNSLVCWVRPPKGGVRRERGNIFQIVCLVSNDRAACHIVLPDYRGSFSQELSGPPM